MNHCTIVIPTHNRPEHLRACLDALADQTEPDVPFSVVIVDDGSETPAVVERGDLPFDVRIVRLDENVGRAAARNAGIERAESDVVIFLDDDIRPLDGFVRAYAERLDPRGSEIGIGDVRFHPDIPRDGLTRYLETRGVGKLAPEEAIPYRYFLTYNSAVPTRLLREVGGFDERLRAWGGEDMELALRLERAGATFSRVPDARALHAHRRTVDGVWEVSRAFARDSMPILFEKHPELIRVLRADMLGSGRVAPRGHRLRRLVLRAVTSPVLAAVVRRMISWFPRTPWPDRAYDYLIAAAWRSGLDDARGRDE